MRSLCPSHLVVLASCLAGSSCASSSPGACEGDTDCPADQTCSPTLGCVPRRGGDAGVSCDAGFADCVSGDRDACDRLRADCGLDRYCEAMAEACRLGLSDSCAALPPDCPELSDCVSLSIRCDRGDETACQLFRALTCPDCPVDGRCDGACPADPDCATCLDSCGPVPEGAASFCGWVCVGGGREGVGCALTPLDPGQREVCATDGLDEDCDELADCLDPDCPGGC